MPDAGSFVCVDPNTRALIHAASMVLGQPTKDVVAVAIRAYVGNLPTSRAAIEKLAPTIEKSQSNLRRSSAESKAKSNQTRKREIRKRRS